MHPLFYSKIQKNILFGKYPYYDGMLFKKDFEKELQDFFSKTLVKKRWSSFLLVFLQISLMIHFQYCFYFICLSE